MRSHALRIASLLLLFSLGGCQSHRPAAAMPGPSRPAATGKRSLDSATRNNSLALLDELLNDEKRIGVILLIKRESPELKRLVKDISEAAGNGAKLVRSMAKSDPGLELAKTDLPLGEQATRKLIARTKERHLLHSKGAEFEFQLLLTQVEALNYGAHLASIAGENEPQPQRSRELSDLSVRLAQLCERVVAMLRTNR